MAIPIGLPVVDVSRFLEWIKVAAADVVKWLALRTLLLGIVGTLVPLAIYKGWLLISEKIMAYTQTQMTGSYWDGFVVQFTGLAGWLSIHLQLQACFMILATALSFKFVLGFVKR